MTLILSCLCPQPMLCLILGEFSPHLWLNLIKFMAEMKLGIIIMRGLMANGNSQVVCILGMGGIGKTTLAQLIYNDTQVKDFFDLRIWLCVSDPFDLDGIVRGIVDSVGTQSIPPNTNQLDLVMEKLRDSISGKKFLLVLDDVWTEDYSKWKPLRINLRYGAQGSKILVTTRKENVPKMMMRGNIEVEIYRPEKLSDEECWRLLRSISLSGRSEQECRMLEDVGKKIASKCEGLPLAANVLGSLLQFKESLEEWENVLKNGIWRLKEAKVELFPHLLLSYNELSPTLKLCFSYCAVYPKDNEIKAQTLIEEWMALGCLGSVGGAEVKGRDYINSLAMRSFFQDIKRSDGLIVECKMHDIVHDFAMFLRGNNEILQQEGGADATKCQVCGLLLVSWVQEYWSLIWDEESTKIVCDCLTSVRVLRVKWPIVNGPPQGMKKLIHLRWLELSGHELSEQDLKIICRLYFLQTLLLSYCTLEKIPIEIGNLVELRHLDLSSSRRLEELPESMCRLVELRILNLNICTDLQRLPQGIHELRNLQRLLIMITPASYCLPQGIGELSNLCALGTDFYGGSGCNKLGLLKKLNVLTGSLMLRIKITITSDLQELVEDAREAELRSKIHIQRLEILFKMEELLPSSSSSSSLASSPLWMKVMKALEPNPQKVIHLEIWCYMGSRLPQWISSPLSLVKYIHLYKCNELSSLPALGKLPFLESLQMNTMKELKFVGRELLGIQSSCSSSSTKEEVVAFPKLKELNISRFPEWEDITTEEECSALSIMPCLERLCVELCGVLKELPPRLLRKASSSLQILNISGSKVLHSRYRDKDGSEWRSISQYNPKLKLITLYGI